MRNPFAVDDAPDPTGADVTDFASSLPASTPDDDNAVAWVAIATSGDGLEGAWSARWRGGQDEDWQQGVATVRRADGKVFILYKDAGTYLIEATEQQDKDGGALLTGRLVNVDKPSETSPWVGRVVTPYRIDGYWKKGRWDLRRSSPDERPEPIVSAVLTEARRLGQAELRELLGFARYLRWRGERH
jgi:hypothetical protein